MDACETDPERAGDAEAELQQAERAKAEGNLQQEMHHLCVARKLLRDASKLLEVGRRLLEIGELREAEEALRSAVQPGGLSPACLNAAGKMFNQLGRATEGAAFLSLAVNLDPQNAWRRLDLAKALREMGQVAASEDQCLAILRDHPGFGYGHFELAKALKALCRPEEALDSFRRAAELQPNEWLILELANELRDRGLGTEAEETFRTLLTVKPTFAPGHAGLAKLLEGLSRPEEALTHFRSAAEIDSSVGWHKMEVARLLRATGRNEEAIIAYEALIESSPGFYHAYPGLASVARAEGLVEKALDAYRIAFNHADANSWHCFEYGNYLAQLGKNADAISVFSSSVARFPDFVHSARRLGEIHCELGEFEQAIECFRRVLAHEPRAGASLKQIVGQLMSFGRTSEAEGLCNEFIRKHPTSGAGLLALAEVGRRREGRAHASKLIEEAVRIDPENMDIMFAKAEDLSASRRFDEASHIYDRLLDKDAGNVWAVLGKGRIAEQRGEHGRSMKLFRQALASQPDNESATIELSRALAEVGEFYEARVVLAPLLQKKAPSALMRTGLNARLEQRYTDALAAFVTLVERDPFNPTALVELATEEFRIGERHRGFALLAKARKLQPGNAESILKLGEIAQSSGELEWAERLFRRAREIDSANPWVAPSVARCLAARGRSAEAIMLLDRADGDLGPLASTQMTRVEILLKAGDVSGARLAMDRAFATFADVFEVWLQRVEFQIRFGEFNAAAEALSEPPPCGKLGHAQIVATRGVLALAQWQIETAATLFDEAFDMGVNDTRIAHLAGVAALLRLDENGVIENLSRYFNFNLSERSRRRTINISVTELGQFFEEVRLHAKASARLRSAPTNGDPQAIAAIVRDDPDFTSAAVNFLVALRRNLRLRTLAKASLPSGRMEISPTIFQFWESGSLPEDISAITEEWRQKNPDFAYRLFDTATARTLLEALDSKDAGAAFELCIEPSQKSNILRLALLFHLGGVYVDADDRCLQGLSAVLPPDINLMLHQEETGAAGTSFIAAAKGHPAIGLALREAVAAVLRGDGDIVWLSTGSGLLTRAMASWLAAEPEAIEERLCKTLILERHEIYRFVAPHWTSPYKGTGEHWSKPSRKRRLANRALIAAAGDMLNCDGDPA